MFDMFFVLAIIYITFISLGLPDSLFGVAWPVMHSDLGLSVSYASIISIVTGICSCLMSLIAGGLIKKIGTSRLTFVSVVLTAVGLLGTRFSTNFWMIITFAVLLGVGAGAVDTALNYYVSANYKAKHINWLHCFWGVGVVVSPLVMSPFLSVGDWRGGYQTIAIMQFAIAFIILCSLPYWRKIEKRQAILAPIAQEKSKEKISFFSVLKIKGVKPSILVFAFYCSMEFLMMTWGASYLVKTKFVGAALASNLMSLYYGGVMLGRLISGFLTVRLRDKQLIWFGVLLSLVGIVVLALPIGIYAVIGLFLVGFGFGPIFPSALHATSHRFKSDVSTFLTGYQLAIGYGVGFTMQLVFGYVTPYIGFDSMPLWMVASSMLLILTLIRLDKDVAKCSPNFLD